MPKTLRTGIFYAKEYMLNYRALNSGIGEGAKGVSVKFYFRLYFYFTFGVLLSP